MLLRRTGRASWAEPAGLVRPSPGSGGRWPSGSPAARGWALQDLMATALALAAYLWQVAYPTPTLAALYEQVPDWEHVALDFAPRFPDLLRASALGLATT
ncbi:MAG TPA: hypothetical protein VGD29_29925 [Actinoplanes sp.]